MKILISIVTVLVILVSAGALYFISDTNDRIDGFKTGFLTTVNETEKNLQDNLLGRYQSLYSDIDNIKQMLESNFDTDLADITEMNRIQANNDSSLSVLGQSLTSLQTEINETIYPANPVYEKIKNAVVRISYKGFLLGSGFIVKFPSYVPNFFSEYIVTAYHVIEITTLDWFPPHNFQDCTVIVTLADGRTYRAYLYAAYEEQDIAILSFTPLQMPTGTWSILDMRPLPSISLADSDSVKPGDSVFVVGSPGDGEVNRSGLKETLSRGIVSQIGRSVVTSSGRKSDCIQFDAPVNYGNSGGPLLNAEGDVIGIVSARINPEEGSGIAFAIPANIVYETSKLLSDSSRILNRIVYFGSPLVTTDYPSTGITVSDILPQDIVANDNTVHSGAVVTSITGLPPEAGILVDDIIIGLDDFIVATSDDYYSMLVANYSGGDVVEFKLVRNGNPLSVFITTR